MEFDINLLILLSFVGLFAGFIDAIAGGGGLITIPAMMLVGIDPISALATNKFQSTFGSATAAYSFYQKGFLKLLDLKMMIFCTFLGSVLGANAVALVSEEFLRIVIPFLLFGICLYFVFKRELSDEDAKGMIAQSTFAFTAAFGIGFYDGIFGPGTGSFFMIAFVILLGFGIRKATAHTKLLNFTSNVAALMVFSVGGHILLPVGLAMGAGQMVGAHFGARVAMKHGAKIIRPILVIVCFALCLRLITHAQHPWSQFIWSIF